MREQPQGVAEAFGEFAATVGTHAGVSWPRATHPRPYAPTGRSTLPHLDRPSLVWLRLRAIFGIGARAEILRSFLAQGARGMSVAALAVATGYTKRNVAEECDTLQRAGVLTVRALGNRFYYSLARYDELKAFVGEMPAFLPDWTKILNVARELVAVERQSRDAGPMTLPVHARRTLRLIRADLDELGVAAPPENVQGVGLWPALRQLGDVYLGGWSIGQWPSEDRVGAVGRRLRRASS